MGLLTVEMFLERRIEWVHAREPAPSCVPSVGDAKLVLNGDEVCLG